MEGLRKEPESETEDPSPPAIEVFKRVVADEIARGWELEQLETSDPMVLAPMVDPRFKLIQSLILKTAKSVLQQVYLSRWAVSV